MSIMTYPLDSVVTGTDSDGLPIYDRAYGAEDLRKVYARFFTNGIFASYAEELQPAATVQVSSTGVSLDVGKGGCMINGAFVDAASETNSVQLLAPGNVGSTPSHLYFGVFVRLDLSVVSRETTIVARYDQAVTPEPERTETVYELCIATVDYHKGTGAGVDGTSTWKVTDTRADKNLCGYCAPFEEVDVSGILKATQELQAQFLNVSASSATLAPGSQATASVSSTGAGTAFTFGIPQGLQGTAAVINKVTVTMAAEGSAAKCDATKDNDGGYTLAFTLPVVAGVAGITSGTAPAPGTGTPGTFYVQLRG